MGVFHILNYYTTRICYSTYDYITCSRQPQPLQFYEANFYYINFIIIIT